MNKFFNVRKVLAGFFVCFVLQNVFAYDYSVPNPELQRVLTIVDTEHEYDLNPHTASYASEANVLNGLYEGLFSYDPVTLEPINAICQTYTVSRNKKRWTFTLRKDINFSDGTPITAQTIRDSWITLLSTPNAPFASLLDCIEGALEFRNGQGKNENVKITVRNENTLVVHLTEPTDYLPRILCHHAFAAVSNKKNVYSGPFVLESYADGHLKMKKNAQYRDSSSVQLPGIEIVQSDDLAENTYLFNIGKADWISGNAEVAKILNTDSIHVAGEFGTSYLFFKMQNKPWNNAEFRLALLEAIPYDELRKDYAVQATTLVYPIAGYPTVAGIKDYDIDDAKELMAEARKKAGLSADEVIPLIFAITSEEIMKTWADILRSAWEPLGVRLVVQVVPFDRYLNSIPSWNADLFSYSWIGDFADPMAFLELFHGGSTLNVAGFADSTFDSLLQNASNAENSSERFKLLSQAEQYLLNAGMIIPISHPISLNIINTELVGGWQTNALDLHPYKYLYIKPSTTSLPNIVLR